MVTGCLRMIKRAPDGSFGWWVRKWSLDWHGILHLSISEPYFCQNIKISTSVWSVQHPNASWNIQHLIADNTFFPLHNTIHTFFNTRQVKKSQSWSRKSQIWRGLKFEPPTSAQLHGPLTTTNLQALISTSPNANKYLKIVSTYFETNFADIWLQPTYLLSTNFFKFSRGEIGGVNLKAPVLIMCVWEVNKSEKGWQRCSNVSTSKFLKWIAKNYIYWPQSHRFTELQSDRHPRGTQ